MSGSNPFRRSQQIPARPNNADPGPKVQNDDDMTTSGRRFPSLDIAGNTLPAQTRT